MKYHVVCLSIQIKIYSNDDNLNMGKDKPETSKTDDSDLKSAITKEVVESFKIHFNACIAETLKRVTELEKENEVLKKKLKNLEIDNEIWRENFSKVDEDKENLEKVNEGLNNRIKELETKLELSSVMQQSSLNVNTWASVVNKGIKKPNEQIVVVNAAINEQKEREKRKKNIIIYGMVGSESTMTTTDRTKEDLNKVENLFREIGSETKPVYVRRFRTKRQDKPAPILVVLNDQAERNPYNLDQVVRCKFNGSKFPGIIKLIGKFSYN